MPTKDEKTLSKIMSGKSDNNIRFSDLINLMISLGFSYRMSGDHYICYHNDYQEILNFQPEGNKAKSYQVEQLRKFIKKSHIIGGQDNV